MSLIRKFFTNDGNELLSHLTRAQDRILELVKKESELRKTLEQELTTRIAAEKKIEDLIRDERADIELRDEVNRLKAREVGLSAINAQLRSELESSATLDQRLEHLQKLQQEQEKK